MVSAPSGAGKTSLLAALLRQQSQLELSVSHTTRPSREGEVDGVHYNFTDREAFERLVEQGRFLEHAEVFGNLYGTSQDWVEAELAAGRDVVLEIDWQGALQVRRKLPDAVTIFILPPSLATLEERLAGRASDDAAVIQKRLAGAREEISHCVEFDYLLVNDVFEEALAQLDSIVEAERLRVGHQQVRQAERLKDLLNPTETR